jgi:mRNA-degrading endonuclease HigB of HigAB toxin-antitoxin module
VGRDSSPAAGVHAGPRAQTRSAWTTGIELPNRRPDLVSRADFVAPHIVFDIGGNKYRLIAEMNFTRKVLFIRCIMTHKEYVKGAWKS